MIRQSRAGILSRVSRVRGRGTPRLLLFKVAGCHAALAAALIATPCAAHHSFANFDMTTTVTLQGTVKELQWTNPHCFVQLLVPGATGSVEWSLEMNSTLASYRAGWRPHTVNSGDTVTVTINPSKDGTPSGRLISAADSSGHALGRPEAPPSPQQGAAP